MKQPQQPSREGRERAEKCTPGLLPPPPSISAGASSEAEGQVSPWWSPEVDLLGQRWSGEGQRRHLVEKGNDIHHSLWEKPGLSPARSKNVIDENSLALAYLIQCSFTHQLFVDGPICAQQNVHIEPESSSLKKKKKCNCRDLWKYSLLKATWAIQCIMSSGPNTQLWRNVYVGVLNNW